MGGSTEIIRRLEDSVGRALVGKPEVVRLAVIGLVARGHLLIEDVPGVGKTTLASAVHGAGPPEPARVRGHVPAAGVPARPLPAAPARRLPRGRRREGGAARR